MTVHVLPKWVKTNMPTYDVTSGGNAKEFSPFTLGPIPLYGGNEATNMENAWQYSKLYEVHQQNMTYADWAQDGWQKPWAVRYPMGKCAKPLFSIWDGNALDYIEARKQIYIPLYSWAVRTYQFRAFMDLRREWQSNDHDFVIKDYDAYDHRGLGYSWEDVINDPVRKMGHGFVLAMMIEGRL